MARNDTKSTGATQSFDDYFRRLIREEVEKALHGVSETYKHQEIVPSESTTVYHPNQKTPGTYVYGLRGIRQMFGVGRNTACKWVSEEGLLSPAVFRDGRKIIVDAIKATEIIEQRARSK